MNAALALAVFIGGGLGSLLRFGLSRLVLAMGYKGLFPLATLITNILASGALAFITLLYMQHKNPSEAQRLFWIVGFCGGFSTFSTFSYENWLLYREQHYGLLAMNIGVSVALGLLVFVLMSRGVGE